MTFSVRQNLYKSIEKERNSKVLTYVTDIPNGSNFGIHQNCVETFAYLLDETIKDADLITLILHTNGGTISTAWQIVNLIKMYCKNLEVLVPSRALSAGTLISLGASRIIMTKQSILGPIDPHFQMPLDISNNRGIKVEPTRISVEELNGFFEFAKNDLSIKNEEILGEILIELSKRFHPINIGKISRTRSQIRKLANKLLKDHVKQRFQRKKIIKFLCSDSGSHDYTINRKEALKLGLNIETPSDELYEEIKQIKKSYLIEMTPEFTIGTMFSGNPPVKEVKLFKTLLESSTESFGLFSKGLFKETMVRGPQDIENSSDQNQLKINYVLVEEEPLKWEKLF